MWDGRRFPPLPGGLSGHAPTPGEINRPRPGEIDRPRPGEINPRAPARYR